jgi:ribosome-associated protein
MSESSQLYITPFLSIPLSELQFQFARSGGKGGQNVNKVETKAELYFDVKQSPSLDEPTRARLFLKLATKLDTDGVLKIMSQESRSQLQNRETATKKFVLQLQAALKLETPRRPTRPTKGSKEKRIEGKKMQSSRKTARRKPSNEE